MTDDRDVPRDFRGHPIPSHFHGADRRAIIKIAEALSERDNWGLLRRGPEQARYVERAIETLYPTCHLC